MSPLVTIVKDNGDLRLCVDMRRANEAIKREHHMMPTIEDFLPRLKEAKFFSRLDIRESYYQMELAEQSRNITTFITHKGLFRFTRLMFGISCAPEMFQKHLEQILVGCNNTVNYIDDIIVFGATEEEHDQALSEVMKVLKERDVLLNHEKCLFKVQELEFLGHIISVNGIRPTVGKTEALEKFREPRSVEEVRSFLGLVTYVGRFLPNLATITAPLRELLRGDKRFTWTAQHTGSFQKLKEMISDIRTLQFFDNTLRTRIIADASPVALGAVLVQFEDLHNINPRIISYASKSLSDTEKRYCQTEKEALALVWAVERFDVYLIGRTFELETDHKPLESIFSPTSKPCARIERWVLRLQSFKYRVEYKRGQNNIADSLSRLVQDETSGEDFEKENKFLILAIKESAAVDVEEVERASREDRQLQLAAQCLRDGKWGNPEVKEFEIFRNELGLIGDLLIRGHMLVVPHTLRNRILSLAHEGHPGESLMVSRLRDRVWWPSMDREAKAWTKACEGCRLVGLPGKPAPMVRRPMPTQPWVDVAIDFMGPLPSNEYLLVIIDYFSRYKEVEVMIKITAKETVNRLDKIFTRLGYPRTITLDNARQFVSKDFDDYCDTHGITLNHSTPYWPQENGLVERQNRSLLKRLQISHALHRDWKKDLHDYLVMYYTTPHTTTGKTPSELMFGRTIRSKMPSVGDIETAPVNTDYSDRDYILKQKQKEREDSRRGAKEVQIQPGDTVLVKNLLPGKSTLYWVIQVTVSYIKKNKSNIDLITGNKLTTTFNPTKFTVVDRSGGRVTVSDQENGKTYERNVAHLKRVVDPPADLGEQFADSDTDGEDFRGFDQIEIQEKSPPKGKRTRRCPTKFNDFVM